jgi:hypothetical protein
VSGLEGGGKSLQRLILAARKKLWWKRIKARNALLHAGKAMCAMNRA